MKKGKRELDKLDLLILKYLQENPKPRIRDLAKKLQVPKSTIYYRVKKLEKAGIIKKYGVFLDSEKLGYEYNVVILVRGKYGPNITMRSVNSCQKTHMYKLFTTS